MTALSQQQLATLPEKVQTPEYDRDATGIGIVHLGPGAFHRAHQAVYTDLALKYGGDWAICGVSMRSTGVRDQLAKQDNLYTLAVVDEQPYHQVIGAIKEVLVLSQQRQQVMSRLTAESTYIISLTVTEKGYCLDHQGQLDLQHDDIINDLQNPEVPISAIGLLVSALRTRRAHNLHQLTVISCDNLSDNGDKLKNAVLAFANQVDGGLAAWIEVNIAFPNTMVDSITPATDAALINQVSEALGLDDSWPIQREAFTQWVVEDNFSGPRPAWEKVGVTLTKDVSSYEKAKLRILNGTHSTLAYVGSRCGFETVYQAISHSALEALLERLLDEQIIPSMTPPAELDLHQYSRDILQRYRNRHIRHLLSQIAWDGSQKLPFRILGTVRDNLASGKPVDLLAVPIAAWLHFVVNKSRNGEDIVDPLNTQLLESGAKCSGDAAHDVSIFLTLQSVFAELADEQQFVTALIKAYDSLTALAPDNIETVIKAL